MLINAIAEFVPRPGAAGYQISNPSALDLNAVVASLEIFRSTTVFDLRQKSLRLTGYLERLLIETPTVAPDGERPFTIITPSAPEERGAQLSLKLKAGILESVLRYLQDNGVVVDERKPDVIRVAPAPLYNTYSDVWGFVQIFYQACRRATPEAQPLPSTILDI